VITVQDTLPSPGEQEAGFLQPGDVVGNYRLVRKLGAGGMGEVFLAEHLQLKRRVAVKTLQPRLAANPEAVRRFFNEGQIVSDLKHENVVDLMDFGQDAKGRVYFVMELLEGSDLCTLREREGPFPVVRAAAILRQVASAMAAIHAKKIIHRDLKPENIFLATNQAHLDFVKLLDFGLAKLSQSSVGVGESTRAGTVLGTPDYMSPEQASGMTVDWRSDIYSFGTIFYWMLTDDLPFHGAPLEEMAAKRQRPAPPLPGTSASGEEIPPGIQSLVDRCLARDPAERPRAFSVVVAELDAAMSPPPEPRKGRGLAARIALGLAAAIAIVGGLGWFLAHGGAPPPPPPLASPAAVVTRTPPVVPAHLALPEPATPAPAHAALPAPVVPAPAPAHAALPAPVTPAPATTASPAPRPLPRPKAAAVKEKPPSKHPRSRPARRADPRRPQGKDAILPLDD